MIKRISKEMEPRLLLKRAKRSIIFVVGGTVLLFGITLIVLPGPAIIVIPVGLAILGSEFIWAKKFLDKIKQKIGFL